MTAAERLKARLADAIALICVLEEQLEQARAEIARLSESEPDSEPVKAARG